MTPMEFLDHLDESLNTHQLERLLTRFTQPSKTNPSTPTRKQLYHAWLDHLLPLLDIPLATNSRFHELQPLYEIVDLIDPYYFTEDILSRELFKCPTLQDNHLPILKRYLAKFFRLSHLEQWLKYDQTHSYDSWSRWYHTFPDGAEWEARKLFKAIGCQVVSSREGARACGRATHRSFSCEEWEAICLEWGEKQGKSRFYADVLAEVFSGQMDHWGFSGICNDVPLCDQCSLATRCQWRQTIPAKMSGIELVQRQQHHKASTAQIIVELLELPETKLQEIENFAQSNTNLLRGLERFSTHDINSKVPNNQHLGEKIHLLLELCRRYNDEMLVPGASFTNSFDIYQYFRLRLRDLKQEHFVVVLLDNKHQYLMEVTVTQGTLNRSLVHPREVFSEAIKHRAAALICVHNHPSGDPTASQQDIDVTHRLREVGTMVGIPLLDHIIIGNDRYVSLADQGLL